MQADDEQRSVSLAINSLPKTEALLVILYYIDENSISEIRKITGLSMANIKIKLYRARKKLERELKFLLDDKSNETRNYGKQGS
jgi:RNA polymerase sigma-70 factor (ECF subfamily)